MKKRKNKFNIIDAAVLVALAALCALLVYGIVSAAGGAGNAVGVRYVLKTENLQSDFSARVAVGDGVYSMDGTEYLGKVTAVSSSPAVYTGTDGDGSPVSSEIEGFSVIYITVETQASSGSTGYTLSGAETEINIGRELKVRFPALCCKAKCVNVETTEK